MFETSTVREWMSNPALVIRPDVPISVAHEIMKLRKVRRLAVVNEHAQLIGIVTLGDVREAEPDDAITLSIWEMNYLYGHFIVGQVMSHDVITIKDNDSIIEAAKLMLDHKISGLPVVGNKGTLIGMITESDIFRMVVNAGESVAATN
jgi:CBS domain-containing protein